MTSESNSRNIGLSILRAIIGFIILKNTIFYFPTAYQYFGKEGIVPWEDFVYLCKSMNCSFILVFFSSDLMLKLYLFILALCSFNFCLGVGGTINGFVLYLLYFFLKSRNGMVLDGSDNVIAVLLPFLILSSCYQFYSVVNKYEDWELRMRRSKLASSFNEVATTALMVQIVFVYFFTAIAKSSGPLWQNGTAIYYTMRVQEFMATSWNIPLTENIYFVVLGTYGTLLIEIAFPFLIWFRSTKFLIMIITASLHVGIFLFMRIDNFSWVMISTYFIFITDSEYVSFKIKFQNLITNYRLATVRYFNQSKNE